MKVLVVGASGATGRLVVEQLLQGGAIVKAMVRKPFEWTDAIQSHSNFDEICASVSELTDGEMAKYLQGCDTIVSCLGHNLTFKGIFGHPRRLVTNAVSAICRVVVLNQAPTPTKIILMNTTGNSNRDIFEKISFKEKCVITLIRLMAPPHADNEKASDFLRLEIGQSHAQIEWAVVRPDSLIDKEKIGAYQVYPSPTRSPIFDSGSTSRINVAHFMAELAMNDDLWKQWRGQMPVIYNDGETS